MKSLRPKLVEFSSVRDLLAVQFFPLPTASDVVVWREDLPGLASVLVFDGPDTTLQVSRVDASCWGKNWDDLFAIAIQNVFSRHKPKNNDMVKLGEIAGVVVVEGHEFFTATFSLLLNKRHDLIGRAGTFVSVPRGGTMLCHAVGSGDANAVCKLLSVLIAQANARGPYSLGSQIYWFHGGQFSVVETSEKGSKTEITGPVELLKALAELASS